VGIWDLAIAKTGHYDFQTSSPLFLKRGGFSSLPSPQPAFVDFVRYYFISFIPGEVEKRQARQGRSRSLEGKS
jgi:hypothetical protein